MSTMRPSHVRHRIADEHTALREELKALEALATRLEAGDATAVDEAHTRTVAFYDHLRDHIDLEDAILAPALRQADAWGDVRADALLKHHREQREELNVLGGSTPPGLPPADLARRLRALVADIRTDMKHEDDALLDPTLLRDDVIAIDGFGG